MKIKNTGDTMTLRGVEFPEGKAVEVDDLLAAKCLAMPNFVPVIQRKKKNDKDG